MPKPAPFASYYLFGCKRCGGVYISAWFPEMRRMSFWNISKSAVIPVSRPKACCPNCNTESEQENLVNILQKELEFERVLTKLNKIRNKGVLKRLEFEKKIKEEKK